MSKTASAPFWNPFDHDNHFTTPRYGQEVLCLENGKANIKTVWVAVYQDGDFYTYDGGGDGLTPLLENGRLITHWAAIPPLP